MAFVIPKEVKKLSEEASESIYGKKHPFGKYSFEILSILTLIGLFTLTPLGNRLILGKKKKRRK